MVRRAGALMSGFIPGRGIGPGVISQGEGLMRLGPVGLCILCIVRGSAEGRG